MPSKVAGTASDVLLLILAVADLAFAGWLLLSGRTAVRPGRLRVTGLLLLLCTGFLLYAHASHPRPEATPTPPPPTSPAGAPPADV